jgi:hypothetical protein
MFAKCVMHPKTYNGTKGNKTEVHKAKAWDIKKEAINPTVQN